MTRLFKWLLVLVLLHCSQATTHAKATNSSATLVVVFRCTGSVMVTLIVPIVVMKPIVHRETVPLMSSGVGAENAFQINSAVITSLTVLMEVMKTSVVSNFFCFLLMMVISLLFQFNSMCVCACVCVCVYVCVCVCLGTFSCLWGFLSASIG